MAQTDGSTAHSGPLDGPVLVRLAEHLADARARLLAVETTLAQRSSTDEAFKAGTTAHLDHQDDSLADLARKLDAVLTKSAHEEEQRTLLLQQQRDTTTAARAGHRETIRTIASTTITVCITVAAVILADLAATWTPHLRFNILISAMATVVLVLVAQYVRTYWRTRTRAPAP